LESSKQLLDIHGFRQSCALFDFDVALVNVFFHPKIDQPSSLQDSHFSINRLDEIKVLWEIENDLDVEQILFENVEGEVLVVLLVQLNDFKKWLDDAAFERRIQGLQT
jgi:hypothetical protein